MHSKDVSRYYFALDEQGQKERLTAIMKRVVSEFEPKDGFDVTQPIREETLLCWANRILSVIASLKKRLAVEEDVSIWDAHLRKISNYCNVISSFHCLYGMPQIAILYCQQSIDMRMDIPPSRQNHSDVLTIFVNAVNIAMIHQWRREYQLALGVLKQAMRMNTRLKFHADPHRRILINALYVLAEESFQEGKAQIAYSAIEIGRIVDQDIENYSMIDINALIKLNDLLDQITGLEAAHPRIAAGFFTYHQVPMPVQQEVSVG